MRYLFLLLAFVGVTTAVPATVHAQAGAGNTVHADIRWDGYAVVPTKSTRKQQVPTFQGAYYEFEEQAGLFSLRLNGAVVQGEITNAVFEPFAAADARLFNLGRLPSAITPSLNQGTEMKLPVTFLSVKAVRRNPQSGQPERLKSFDYTYILGSSLAARGTLANRTHAPVSVLNTGDWYKIGVAESGIYKLDRATLDAMGISTQSMNPAMLKLYGNSMGVLPQANASYRPDDLVENALRFVGNNDNIFDNGEYFLFYSAGAHTWELQSGMFRHRNNIYTDTTYYFVTIGAAGSRPGRRVITVPTPAASSAATITTFTDRYFYEHDLVNLMQSGRQWVGEGFNNGSQRQFTFSGISDLVPGSPAKVTSTLVASASKPSTFQLTLNGTALGSQLLDTRPASLFENAAIATVNTTTHAINLPASTGTELRFNLAYASPADPTGTGYLDYLDVNVLRQLRLSGSQLQFRSLQNIGPQAMNRFVLTNVAGASIWDVTDPRNPRKQTIDSNSGDFIASGDSLREFIAFQETGSFEVPRRFGRVANQNLHALGLSSPLDLVIVTYPPFKAQAQRLADHRLRHDGLRSAVVTTTEVYNEFSSGGQDVTAIRDFMKQIYDRAPAGQFTQLLLFGDASFDYKSDPTNDVSFEPTWWQQRTPFKSDANFNRTNQNYVPTYESRESLAPFFSGEYGQASYSSDDYFGMLDDDEGEWRELSPSSQMLDIGVGRLPVRTPKDEPRSATQAQQVVDKIISYDATAAYGKWRNRVTLLADDGNGNLFVEANRNGSDQIANTIQRNAPAYNLHKVYLDLYPQQRVAAGERSPEMNQAIDASVEQGSLIVNYLGHGGPKGLADEQIVTSASVMALQNINNLAFLVTGTCDFSTYDNPDFTSAGEQVFTDNTNGGAVGLFTTTRLVDASQNAGLNLAFYENVFRSNNGKMPSIGQVVMNSKNNYPGVNQNDVNNRNYTLLADPSMILAYPRQTVVLDSIVGTNGLALDTLRALEQVRLHGKVLNNGVLNTSFNGTAQITIFDKPTRVMTLGDEVDDTPIPVTVQENIIFGGQASVSNGQFNVTFMVPKDINYNVGQGKISLYASDPSNSVRGDAHGFQLARVGSAAQNVPADSIPPIIKLYMDHYSFVFGGLTAQNTTLLAKLSDDNGINTTGAGIGHEITAILDRDPSKLIILNDAYVSEVNNFRAGKIDYLFKDLSVGPHSIRVKAWDTHNNSAEQEIEFIVAKDEELALDHVLNYPNPFANTTTFHFDHNRSGQDLDVQVQIFTVAGKLVRTLTTSVSGLEAGAHQKSISWNGRDEYDDQLARGVYVYRLSVRCGQSTASKFEKLVILN